MELFGRPYRAADLETLGLAANLLVLASGCEELAEAREHRLELGQLLVRGARSRAVVSRSRSSVVSVTSSW